VNIRGLSALRAADFGNDRRAGDGELHQRSRRQGIEAQRQHRCRAQL